MNKRTKNTVQLFDKYAESYAQRFMDVSLYAPSLKEFCRLLPPHGSMLELGCGPGNVTAFLLKQREDLQILATDLSEEMLKITRKNLPGISCRPLNFKELENWPHRYEAVMAAFCLPYLNQAETASFMHQLAVILEPGGIIYMSLMEGDHELSGMQKSSNGQDEMMIFYHSRDWLLAQLQEKGFEVVFDQLIDQPEEHRSSGKDLVIIARSLTGD
ncbi:class I SAM-dependent DNA methyltransferase [Christiangramia flava]|uniref:Uncharacterized protein n=1 Tax=Christiangramia flava JLT2011 TaxID=1229726 RepID=A0A1L7I7B0_9FLAO|nr:class I SAM-dependent methyltransferase [Christiangramia flava]APU69498.1 hypothetical protein GRFL_2774 [Christiangramia flava JLT2011]OSS37900.1 Methyltransferase type 11 [Christiangramia flava JLT2011]